MPITPEARARLISLYSYLKAVSLRSHPPVKHVGQQEQCWRLNEFPEHASLFVGLAEGRDSWLELKKPEIHLCPEPPAELKPWLHDGWDALDKERAKHKDEIIRHDAQGQPITVARFMKEKYLEKQSANFVAPGQGLPLQNLRGETISSEDVARWKDGASSSYH